MDLGKLLNKREYIILAIQSHICAWCGDEITGFKDEKSRKKYLISGMCQACQDILFEEEQ